LGPSLGNSCSTASPSGTILAILSQSLAEQLDECLAGSIGSTPGNHLLALSAGICRFLCLELPC
jgi:hypothetical protein